MVTMHQVIAFGLVALVLIAIPGPSVVFTVGRALTYGRTVALTTVVGNSLGLLAALVLVSLGLGDLVATSDAAFEVVKIGGAVVPRLPRHPGAPSPARHRGHAPGTTPRPCAALRALRQGFIVGFTNPKAYVIFAAVLPPFVDRDRGNATVQMLLLGLVAFVIGLCSDSLLGAAGQPAAALVQRLAAARARARYGGRHVDDRARSGRRRRRTPGHRMRPRREAAYVGARRRGRAGGGRRDVRRGRQRTRRHRRCRAPGGRDHAARRSRPTTTGTPTSASSRSTRGARQWLSHMSTGGRPAPRLRPVVRRRPQLRHPDHRRRARPPRVRVHFQYAERERPGPLPARRATPGSRAAGSSAATGTRSSSTRARAGSTRPSRPGSATGGGTPAPGAVWSLTSDRLRPERLDLRRRRRPADPARPAALERGQAPRHRPRHPLHHRRHLDAPPLAGPARRRVAAQLDLPADGCPLPAARVVPPDGLRAAGDGRGAGR